MTRVLLTEVWLNLRYRGKRFRMRGWPNSTACINCGRMRRDHRTGWCP